MAKTRLKSKRQRRQKLLELFSFLFIGRFSVLWYCLGLAVQVLVKLSDGRAPVTGEGNDAEQKGSPQDDVLSLAEDEKKIAAGVRELIRELPRLERGWVQALRHEYERARAERLAGTHDTAEAERASTGALYHMVRRRLRVFKEALPLPVVRLGMSTLVCLSCALLSAAISVSLTILEFVLALVPGEQAGLVFVLQQSQTGLRYFVVLCLIVGGIAAVRGLILLASWLRAIVREALS